MNAKKLLVLAMGCTMVLQLVQVLQAACVCNEEGTDYCQGCNERRVVRPKQKYYNGENSELDLSPIGDNCWCSKLLIEPAVVPKVYPKQQKETQTCSCSEPAPSISYVGPDVNYVKSVKDDSPPADPISVSLAIQAGKAIQVPEAKLSYGFVGKPLNGLQKVYFSDVPEENLYKLKNEVIALKKRTQTVQKTEEEEWQEEEEEQEAADEEDEQPYLSYKELGYVAEQYKNPKFKAITSSAASNSLALDSDCGTGGTPVQSKVSVDCGFKPGRISPYRTIRNRADINDCFERA